MHLCVFNQCRAVALDADRQTDTQADGQGRAWCCCLVLRPGLETADWCKIETRGWNREREDERVSESQSRLMAREREGERDGAQERRVGGRRDRGRDIIEPVWVSRLTELQGAAPAHHCYCKFPSLYGIHPKVHLIPSDLMSLTLEPVCFLLDVINK